MRVFSCGGCGVIFDFEKRSISAPDSLRPWAMCFYCPICKATKEVLGTPIELVEQTYNEE